MGSIRSQAVNNSQAAIDQAEQNKTDASNAASIPALRVVVENNAIALQSNSAAIQRLEQRVAGLSALIRGTQ